VKRVINKLLPVERYTREEEEMDNHSKRIRTSSEA
jgi:hypothetical protein